MRDTDGPKRTVHKRAGRTAFTIDGAGTPTGTDQGSISVARVSLTPDGRMTLDDAAIYLGITVQTLRNWRSRGRAPRSLKVGGKVFFYRVDLDRYIAGEAA
jgi:excisionase family DNA binding protein